MKDLSCQNVDSSFQYHRCDILNIHMNHLRNVSPDQPNVDVFSKMAGF